MVQVGINGAGRDVSGGEGERGGEREGERERERLIAAYLPTYINRKNLFLGHLNVP